MVDLTLGEPDSGPLREEIALSWRRSQLSGLRPSSPTDRLTWAEIDRGSRLVRAAAPVLDQMAEQLADTPLSVILADRNALIVDRRFGERTVGTALDGIGVVPGIQYLEETTGTNAIATPHELRRGVSVHGDEHFLEALKRFACYGHPIVHPVTKRLQGVLDITARSEDANPLFAPFLVRAVKDIEQRLLDSARESTQLLFAAFQSARRRSTPVLVLGEELVLANAAAADLLDATDHAVLRDLAADVVSLGPKSRRLRLCSGTVVQVRAERIVGTGGAAFELTPVDAVRTPVPRRRKPTGTAAAATTAATPARTAAAARHRVLIAGEPGSGRTTAARALADGHDVAVLDAADVPALGVRRWAAHMDELLTSHPGLTVVESLHLLPAALAARLSRILDTAPARAVLTSAPLNELSGEHACLAGRIPDRVELPPLRARREELPELARAMLAACRPGRAVRFAPGALELLAAQPWPGNLRELEAVVRYAADARSAGDITARDLPPSCQGSPRKHRLSAWEQAEHDAILSALRATGGNKVHAAERLGISRSTLYNRIRSLGITV
ncbi:sigma-54-dependent Fis family transcriptional regulator [Streptomyces boluensis]|uniref:Sigma-54 factor interaction domain-containing protein n=1 Tax=Streptomyces boluensis TaxID=1775135 RepID=A0A964UPB0_9ACTN|nr:helix-turn-helix domain-containing protein [Streptomyces boluensis]NBE51860.1 hypothetical protein [Streptomyces boluensis]